MRADYETARHARQACAYDPAGCDFAAVALPNSPMDAQTRDLMQTRIDANLRAVDGHGEVKVRVESINVEGDRSFLTMCGYDTVVIYDVADPANPADDIVFNDQSASFRVRWELRLDDGRWRIFAGETVDQKFDADLCGF